MGTLLIIILFLLTPTFIIGLFIFLEAKRKQRVRNRLEKAVDYLARQNNLLIVNLDYFRDNVIGIDKKNKKLIFVHFKNGLIDESCIDLNMISTCIVSKKIDRNSGSIAHIFLHLRLKGKYEMVRLNFYDNFPVDPRTKTTLLEKARYWKDQINLNRRLESADPQCEYIL